MLKMKCYLKCISGTHKPIQLENCKNIVLGRSPITKIKDSRCSKRQVELIAIYGENKVKYKHLGPNPGGFLGSQTKSGEEYVLHHEDKLEFLYGKYPHQIVFEPCQANQSQLKCEDLCDTDASEKSPMKGTEAKGKRKREESTEKFFTKKSSPPFPSQGWENFDENDLLVYDRCCPGSSKIAAYDMDGTLITTLSGRVFPKDINDWKILYPDVPGKLKKLQDDGYKILIFTNQLGVSKGKISAKDIQTKIMRVIEKVGVRTQALVSTRKGKYRKPLTGMWDFFIEKCNESVEVDKEKSLYIGDAAGRPEIPKQRKKDHSVADRLFALNVGIPFQTPEEHFLGHKQSSFKMPEFIPSEIDASTPLYSPSTSKVPNHPLEVILMVGYPGSGKSTFVEKHLLKSGYFSANRDTIGTWQKCVALMERCIEDGKHVVIDNTNPDKASRQRYIEIAKKKNIPIRCFLMNVSLNQSLHNNKFRELTGSHHTKVNEMIFNSYKSKYEEPTLREGFTDIVKVNFQPYFKNDEQEKLYKLFLLEK